jgi:hypothetical protein
MRCGAKLSIFQGTTRDKIGGEIDDARRPRVDGDRQQRTAWRPGGGGEKRSGRELGVEIGAEAPAGSPLTLSETGPLKPMLRVTRYSVGCVDALHNGTNGLVHGQD